MPKLLANSVVINMVLCDYLGQGGWEMNAQSLLTGFLCSFGACPGTCSVGQAGLELIEIRST